jgi:hypothetical protein
VDIYQIEIIEPGAKKLLDDMADLDLITVRQIDVEGENGNGAPAGHREAIMSLAGSWKGMSDGDFEEYLSEAKRTGREMFDRDVSL